MHSIMHPPSGRLHTNSSNSNSNITVMNIDNNHKVIKRLDFRDLTCKYMTTENKKKSNRMHTIKNKSNSKQCDILFLFLTAATFMKGIHYIPILSLPRHVFSCTLQATGTNRCMQRETKERIMDALHIHGLHYIKHIQNLCECSSLIRQYEAYLAKFFIESDGAWFSSNCAITAHCSHVHITADMMTVTQPH